VSPTADAVHEGASAVAVAEAPVAVAEAPVAVAGEPVWTADGEAELHKIPFFVRGKVRRNTETFARERGLAEISAETLYDAKAHFSR
jgi:light-independent protochlorophyllide reductase subunit B